MKLIGDYHTHTVYSHGKGSIEENVLVARSKGIKTIGICDHGPGHAFYGVKRENFKVMREEIDALNEKYDDIEILLGVEANFIDFQGHIDIREEELKYLDYIAAGYHFGIIPNSFANANLLYIASKTQNISETTREKLRHKTTDSMIKAINAYDIKFITHPGAKLPVDVVRLNRACYERGTYLEVNRKHGHLSNDELLLLRDEKTRLIVGSDAHSPEKVGEVSECVERIRKAGIDIKNIVNVEFNGGI